MSSFFFDSHYYNNFEKLSGIVCTAINQAFSGVGGGSNNDRKGQKKKEIL